MGKIKAAIFGAGIGGVVLGPIGALAGGALGLLLEHLDEGENEEAIDDSDEAAITLSPDGVKLNESNMTIPWDKVYSVRLDEEDDTINVHFVGGLFVFSENYDFEEGWDNFYRDARAIGADLDEDDLRNAVMQSNGIEILKAEWERRVTSALIANRAFDDASPEEAIYAFTSYSAFVAINFGKVYVELANTLRCQIVNPGEVKALLEYWLSIMQKLNQNNTKSRREIRDLRTLIQELEIAAIPDSSPNALPDSAATVL